MRKGIYKDQKRGTWYISTRIKIGDEYKTFTKRGYLTAREADYDFERVVELFKKENEPHHAAIFFQDLVKEYQQFRLRTVRLQTARADESVYSKYLYIFNNHLLKDVFTLDKIKDWFNNLVNNNNISAQRKNKIITRFKDLLKFAYMSEYIDAPTYQKIDINTYKIKASKKPMKEKVAWSHEELNQFLSVIDTNDKWYVLFRVMFHLGCRIGELQGLQWQDFDYQNKRIHITRQVIEGTGQNTYVVSEELKTEVSDRYDRLTDDLNELLEEYKISCGVVNPTDFIFFGSRPISRNSIRRKMYEYIELAGVRKTTPHGARHTVASFWMQESSTMEECKAGASFLGHSISMMTETYGHLLHSSQDEMLERIHSREIKKHEKSQSDTN